MSRSELVIQLVEASTSGDRTVVRKTVEAMIAEEKARRHNGLADRLSRALTTNQKPGVVIAGLVPKGRDYLAEVTPRRQLCDLCLTPGTSDAILEFIEEQTRADLLRSHGMEPRNRILLVGPPGNGKTSLAEAISEALGVGLFVVRYELLIGSYLGETATRLKRTLDYARTSPCVLFFDEFDAIAKERGDTHETGEIKRVVSSLLMQIDELPSHTVLIGATNHPELLDRAAGRRFQLHIDLPAPRQADVAAYIEKFSNAFEEDLGATPLTIARKLGKVSYSDVEEFCLDLRRAQILAMGNTALTSILKAKLSRWARRGQGC
jgi:ATPase family associated with various cellular activities (AAA)